MSHRARHCNAARVRDPCRAFPLQNVRTKTFNAIAGLSVFSIAPDDAIVVVRGERQMIEGLKLTMTGDELRSRLDERVKYHERLVDHDKREAKREPDPKDEYDCVLPEHMCEYEQEFHLWRVETLAYIREHVEGGEVYRLGPNDVEFGEILPQKPGVVEQEEFDRENSIGFSMERIAKDIGGSSGGAYAIAEALAQKQEDKSSARRRKPVKRTSVKRVLAERH